MNKFTAGPWELKNAADIFTPLGATNAEGIDAPSDDGWHIADCDMGGLCLEEVEANARLMAAAPDLLYALEALCACITDTRGPDSFAALMAARKAIDKARSQS